MIKSNLAPSHSLQTRHPIPTTACYPNWKEIGRTNLLFFNQKLAETCFIFITLCNSAFP